MFDLFFKNEIVNAKRREKKSHGIGEIKKNLKIMQCKFQNRQKKVVRGRDGKSLHHSTRKTLSLKIQHTKYEQKMLKIVRKCQKLHKKCKNL